MAYGIRDMSGWSFNTWIIVINIAVFVIDVLIAPAVGYPPFAIWGHFSTELAIQHAQVWRFITFQFLHANLMHIFGNLFCLFMFGGMIESHFGSRRYLAFYLLCGIAGALTYLLFAYTGVLDLKPWQPMVGASAGIFGILVAGAYIAPDRQVYSFIGFIPIPMKMRHFAILLMGLALYTVFTQGANAGGEAAHLGGGVLGLVFMLKQHWLNVFAPSRRGKRKMAFKDWSKEWDR